MTANSRIDRDDAVRLVMGDCLEVMGGIGAGSVDLIAADLPYGTTACRWDAVIPFGPMWELFNRVLKDDGVVVLTASQPFTSALVTSNILAFRYEWIWEKSVGTGFLDVKLKPLKCHESALVFYRRAATYNPQKWPGKPNHSERRNVGRDRDTGIYRGASKIQEPDTSGEKYPRSVLYFPKYSCNDHLHKTQKPVALFEYLILTYTNPGETVLDCTMGSGTTGVAAVNTGRRFIGIERDPDYFAVASRRIDEARRPLVVGQPLMGRKPRPRADRPGSDAPGLFDAFN